MNDNLGLSCPVLDTRTSGRVTLAHGEGGRLMRELVRRHLVPALDNPILAELSDAAVLPVMERAPVFTTDSFVVAPLVFPGGDIGSLAVYGTANDLAVAGAKPRWISLALIIEEGFSGQMLEQLVASVAAAARRAEVTVVTGDTKVVPRGAVDGLFINTAGVGELVFPMPGPSCLESGDELVVSGPIGRHGIAVLAAREGLEFEPPPASDSAPLLPAVDALRAGRVPVKALRDATRGGVAAVLHEWAGVCGRTMAVEADQMPVTDEVRGACELLGLDPLHVACEGTMVVAVAAGAGDRAVQVLRETTVARAAKRIGAVIAQQLAPVVVRRSLGELVPLDEPMGAPLPRIC